MEGEMLRKIIETMNSTDSRQYERATYLMGAFFMHANIAHEAF
jgi:hypothetical protein